LAETNLHQQLKQLYVGGSDQTEHPVGAFRIDAVRHSGDLIEVQTANFAAIRPKLAQLLAERKVILVHPICETRHIVKVDRKTGEAGPRRRSPRRGNWFDAFDELVHLTDLLPSPNLTVELLLTEEEERRYPVNGRRARWRGSFRSERRLVRLLGRKTLKSAEDYLAFLPESLQSPFTTRGVALSLGVGEHVARQIAYCLREMGLLKVAGKIRNNILYVRRDEKQPLTGDGLKRLELRELRRSDWQAYETRIREYYGGRAGAVLAMEERLAELAELLRDTEPDRAETLLEREKHRLRRP
jgi:hypothetical protein